MKKKIVIINGSGGVGKDTFVELCGKYVKVRNVSAVDKVKEAANILIDWDGVKDEKYRKLLVDLKQLSVDFNDAPTKYLKKQAEEFIQNEEECLMFIHIREISEIKKLKELIDAKTLLITSKRVPVITSNSSDANVANYDYDLYITNDGTVEELEEKAKKFALEG